MGQNPGSTSEPGQNVTPGIWLAQTLPLTHIWWSLVLKPWESQHSCALSWGNAGENPVVSETPDVHSGLVSGVKMQQPNHGMWGITRLITNVITPSEWCQCTNVIPQWNQITWAKLYLFSHRGLYPLNKHKSLDWRDKINAALSSVAFYPAGSF